MTSKTSTAATIAFWKDNVQASARSKIVAGCHSSQLQVVIVFIGSSSTHERLTVEKGMLHFGWFSSQDPGHDLAFQNCVGFRLWPRGICLRTAVMIRYMDANGTVTMCVFVLYVYLFVHVFDWACIWAVAEPTAKDSDMQRIKQDLHKIVFYIAKHKHQWMLSIWCLNFTGPSPISLSGRLIFNFKQVIMGIMRHYWIFIFDKYVLLDFIPLWSPCESIKSSPLKISNIPPKPWDTEPFGEAGRIHLHGVQDSLHTCNMERDQHHLHHVLWLNSRHIIKEEKWKCRSAFQLSVHTYIIYINNIYMYIIYKMKPPKGGILQPTVDVFLFRVS